MLIPVDVIPFELVMHQYDILANTDIFRAQKKQITDITIFAAF